MSYQNVKWCHSRNIFKATSINVNNLDFLASKIFRNELNSIVSFTKDANLVNKMPCLLMKDLPEMHAAANKARFKPKLHRFPSDPELRKRWYTAIQPFMYKFNRPARCHELCSLHFKPSDFIRNSLIDDSVPSVFSPPSIADLCKLSRKRAYARCCVIGCSTSDHFNLYPFVPDHDAADSELSRKRYRLWVWTLQVAPCRSRQEVWICRRHFVCGYPADLSDRLNVDWVPSLYLEGIPPNPCLECSVVLRKLPEGDSSCDDGVPNLNMPFCRLCLGQNMPLQSMFLDSSAGQRLAELIEKFVTIKIDFQMDSSGSVCIGCLEKLAQMEEMEQVRARWNANNDLLERLRGNNNHSESKYEETAFIEDSPLQEVNSHAVVSIPMDSLIDSILESPKDEGEDLAYDDFKQELEQHNPANISQDCIIVEPPESEVIDLTDIDERERLIRQAMRSLRKQLKPGKRKRKRSKTNLETPDDEPSHRKPCRDTRIG